MSNVIKDGNGTPITVASTTTSAGIQPMFCLSDPASGNSAAVQIFHNADNTAPGGNAYGILTGGVAQMINGVGNLDRQRGTTFDNIPNAGVASGSQQYGLRFTTTSATAVSGAGTVTITPAAMSGTINGSPWSIQVGHDLLVDTGTAQEAVRVTAVTSTTFTATFAKAHSSGFGIAGFVYNIARDASGVGDTSNGTGMSPSTAMFYNGVLGTYERERSAAGELDSASGIGTAVAAEYLYDGVGYDRARSLQGKYLAVSTINSGGGTGSQTLTLAATPNGLTPGQDVRLYNGSGYEGNTVSSSYTAGSTSVPLNNPIANGTHTQLQYDCFNVNGPGLGPMTGVGIGIEEEAVWCPSQNSYYLERSADADGMSVNNIVAEAECLFNGTTMDRARGGLTGIQTASTGMANEIVMAQYNTTAPAPANGNMVNLQADQYGNLKTTAGQVTINSTAPSITTSSGSILAARANREYLMLQNNDASATVWINFGQAATVAAPSLKMAPGTIYVMESSAISGQQIFAIGSAATSNLTVMEGY